MLRLVQLLTCSLLISAACLWGQFGSGLQGTIVDRTSAVVPGARVIVTNTETGVSRTTVTSDEGIYRFTSLNAGTYRLTATKEGFGGAEQGSVVVGVNE